MTKIIGNTTATPNPRPDWNQTDETKADYIKNKPIIGDLASLTEITRDNLTSDVQESLDKADSALQSYVETDPTVPDWAKTPTKPTYTAEEVGALPIDTVIPSTTGLASEDYVDTKVASLVDSAPETLNTLNELAAALGDDPNFATTVATEIGKKVDKVEGKNLSTNDFTDTLKSKLEGIESGANKYVHPNTHNVSMIEGLADVATSGSFDDLKDVPQNTYLLDDEGTLYLPEGDYRPAIKGDSVFIRYSQCFDGTDFTTSWSKGQCYIGIYVGDSAPDDKSLYQWILFIGNTKPETTIPAILSTNTSYNFGEVTELSLSFPTDASDGDTIYITFTSGTTATNLIVDATNTSDFELIPEANSGYEICGKFNGILWILSDFEYTYTVG